MNHFNVLIQGATIIDCAVNITPAENYQLPPGPFSPHLVNSMAFLNNDVYIYLGFSDWCSYYQDLKNFECKHM